MRRSAGVALSGVVLMLAAFTFDAAPLFVPGVAFALLGALTPLWVGRARGARPSTAGCSRTVSSKVSRSRR